MRHLFSAAAVLVVLVATGQVMAEAVSVDDGVTTIDPGEPGDGWPDLILTPWTGNLMLDTDELTLDAVIIESDEGIFTGAIPNPPFRPRPPEPGIPEPDPYVIGAGFGLVLSGEYDVGDVIGPEFRDLQPDFYYHDLTFFYTMVGSPGSLLGTLIIVPEPGTLTLLLLGALGLAGWAWRHSGKPATSR